MCLNKLYFSIGDILLVIFELKGIWIRFKGICLYKRNKNLFVKNNSVIIIRNILDHVGVELNFKIQNKSNFIFFIYKYQRKKLKYRSSKLYYLRNKLNKLSFIK